MTQPPAQPGPSDRRSRGKAFSEGLRQRARSGAQKGAEWSRGAAQQVQQRAQHSREQAAPLIEKGRAQAQQGWASASEQAQRGAQTAQQWGRTTQEKVAESMAAQFDEHGTVIRPLTIKIAAGLGAAAGLMMLAYLLLYVTPFFARIKKMAGAAENLAHQAESMGLLAETAATIANASAGFRTALTIGGYVVFALVALAYALYAWRTVNGRGHARVVAAVLSVALIPVAVVHAPGMPTLPPLVPLQPIGFACTVAALVFGVLSIVLAFHPRSHAWLRRHRRTAPALPLDSGATAKE